jgi:sec-independent protein translocase protein TatA
MVAAAGPFGLGAPELLIIFGVVLLLFGATRLADIGGGLGKGIKEFRKNVKEEAEEEETPPAAAAPPPAPTASAETAERVMDRPEAVSALKCPNCGGLNPIGARHCNNCGASIATPVT